MSLGLENLSYIGHCGNFMFTGDVAKAFPESDSAPHIMSLYNSALEFEGTANLLSGTGIMTVGNSEITEVGASIHAVTDRAHNIAMITFGLNSIFHVGQSGLLPNLEALSVFKYMEVSNLIKGFHMPTVVTIPLGGGKGR